MSDELLRNLRWTLRLVRKAVFITMPYDNSI